MTDITHFLSLKLNSLTILLKVRKLFITVNNYLFLIIYQIIAKGKCLLSL